MGAIRHGTTRSVSAHSLGRRRRRCCCCRRRRLPPYTPIRVWRAWRPPRSSSETGQSTRRTLQSGRAARLACGRAAASVTRCALLCGPSCGVPSPSARAPPSLPPPAPSTHIPPHLHMPPPNTTPPLLSGGGAGRPNVLPRHAPDLVQMWRRSLGAAAAAAATRPVAHPRGSWQCGDRSLRPPGGASPRALVASIRPRGGGARSRRRREVRSARSVAQSRPPGRDAIRRQRRRAGRHHCGVPRLV